MAKDKEFEKRYLRIKLSRAVDRRANRNWLRRINKKDRYEVCDECGGNMPWCSSCETYTRTCCVDWGTCMCS